MIPISGGGIINTLILLNVSFFVLALFAALLLISGRFRRFVIKRKGWVLVVLSPFIYVSVMYEYVHLRNYIATSEYRAQLKKAEQYRIRYSTLQHEETLLGITMPAGTKITGWRVMGMGVIVFERASFPEPILYHGISITYLGFEGPTTIRVGLAREQRIGRDLCGKWATFIRDETGVLALRACV